MSTRHRRYRPNLSLQLAGRAYSQRACTTQPKAARSHRRMEQLERQARNKSRIVPIASHRCRSYVIKMIGKDLPQEEKKFEID